MNTKKKFAVLAAATLIFGTVVFTSCATEGPTPGIDVSKEPAPSVTASDVVVTENYVITYEAGSAYAKKTAAALQAELKNERGLDLPVQGDQASDETDFRYEILVGITNRIDALDLTEELKDEDWMVAEADGRILLAGKNGVTLDAALTHFEDTYLKNQARPAIRRQTRDTGSVPLLKRTTDVTKLQRGLDYSVSLEKAMTFRSADNLYGIMQGAAYAKGKIFAAATYKKIDGAELTRILVVNPDGTVEKESEPLTLDHANAITYVKKWDKLLVSHCQSNDGHFYRYSLVDPETLEITESHDLEKPFFAMAYDEETDRFFSGEWSGGTLDVWDGDLHLTLSKGVEEPESLSQSLYASANGAYFVRSAQNNAPAEIRIYDWECNLTMTVIVPTGAEPEAIFLIDGVTYIICNDFAGAQALVYRLSFEA